MNTEHFEIGEKIVYVLPVGKYCDVFSMTGNIVSIDKTARSYIIELDEPSLLECPEIWQSNSKFLVPTDFDMVLGFHEFDEDGQVWLNKGKKILENSNCFFGLIYALNTIIDGINNDHSTVAIQTLLKLDVSWMNDEAFSEAFQQVLEMFGDQLISIDSATKTLSNLRSVIEQKYKMLN